MTQPVGNRAENSPLSPLAVNEQKTDPLSIPLKEYLDQHALDLGPKISKGGFGTVYFLKPRNDPFPLSSLDQKVIKVIHQFDERFRSNRGEHLVNAIPASSHFVPVQCLYYNQEAAITENPHEGDPLAACIMPFVAEGMSLEEHIETMTTTPKMALKIVLNIALALQELAHEQIAHRDLKPQNIMVKQDGSIVLLDFGLAKLYEDPLNPESPVGTRRYVAPELLRSQSQRPLVSGDAIGKSDVYSLGKIFSDLLVLIPNEFNTAIHAMTERDPRNRWSIEQVIEHLSSLSSAMERDARSVVMERESHCPTMCNVL